MIKYIVFMLLIPSLAWGISVGEMTYFMGPEQSFLSKAVHNDSKKTRYYQVSIEESDPPYAGAKEHKIKQGALLYGPKQLLLRPDETQFLKLYYRGPADDQPRYYRVVFHERPGFTLQGHDPARFNGSASLGTILVVQPRRAEQGYQIKENILYNTGNTVYLAYLKAPCALNKTEECIKEKYLIPGETLALDELDIENSTLFLSNEAIAEHRISGLAN